MNEEELQEYVERLESNDATLTRVDLVQLLVVEGDEGNEDTGHQGADQCANIVNNVARALENNTSVTELTLQWYRPLPQRIDVVGARAIARALERNQSINSLSLQTSQFVRQDSVQIILQALERETGIKNLSVECSFEHRRTIRAISILLERNDSIETLTLKSLQLDDHAADILAPALKINTSIKVLDFRWIMSLGVRGATALCRALGDVGTIKLNLSWTRQIATLIRTQQNISHLLLDDELHRSHSADAEIMNDFANSFVENTSITVLCVHDIRFTDSSFDAFTSSLASAGTIEELHLHAADLGNSMARSLSRSFRSNTSLRELSLTGPCGMSDLSDPEPSSVGDGIGDTGATALSELLRVNTTLEVLRVNGNRIGNAGAVALADAILSRATPTKELDLDMNEIGDTGVGALSQLLLHSGVGLESLSLAANMFSLVGCKSFSDALASDACKSIRVLCLELSRSADTDESNVLPICLSLIRALRDNRTLKTFFAPTSGKRDITEEQWQMVEDAYMDLWKHNHILEELNFRIYAKKKFYQLDVRKMSVNRNGPVVASTMKGVPFPHYLVKGLADSAIPLALVSARELAGLDGVYSFVRQMHSSVTRCISTMHSRGTKRKCGDTSASNL